MKSKESHILILMILLLAAGITAWVLLYNKTNSLYLELSTKQENIATAKAKDLELSSIQQDIKSTLGDYDKIRSIFVSKEHVVEYIQDLENYGKEMGLVVKINGVSNVELEPVAADKERLVISFAVYGTRAGNLNYLELLEHLPYKVSFDQITLEQDPQSEHPGGWRLSGNIVSIKTK